MYCTRNRHKDNNQNEQNRKLNTNKHNVVTTK